MFKLDDLDPEMILSWEGVEYRISNGNNGLQLVCRSCPFCNNDNYKTYMNAETGLGNCFRCGTGFNLISFVGAIRGLKTKFDTIRYLKNNSLNLTYRPRSAPVYRETNKDWVLPQNFPIELEDHLPKYLKDRNVDAKLSKRFDLRFCEYGFYKYKNLLEKDCAVDFSQRIIIPIKDIDGNLVTFQGRDITGDAEKKYLFPNMLPGTGRYIFNANYAVTSKAKKIVLNEGVFDVFAMTAALESDLKYKDFVACGTFGKHLSISAKNNNHDDQLSDLFKLFASGVDEFILLWDGERDAIKAAYQTVARLNEYGLNSTVAVIGGGLDPAETDHKVLLDALDNRKRPTVLDLVRMKLDYEHT